MKIANACVLLTGASGGIGRHLAIELARKGARLALVGRDRARLQATADEVAAIGATAVALPFNLASCSGHAELVDAAATEMGGLDVLINNAGVQRFKAFGDDDPSAIAALVTVNVTSALLLAHAALVRFRAAGSGHIVNVGSTFGSIAHPYFAAYSASKFALRGFSEALRRELLDSSIRVTYVSPRATATKMNGPAVREMQLRTGARVDEPRSVAKAVIAALEADAAEMQLGWPERFFVRLNALWPRLVDRALARQNRSAEFCVRRFDA